MNFILGNKFIIASNERVSSTFAVLERVKRAEELARGLSEP
ncbi:hypothetical protein LEP1GSC106_0573 [Leptospira interrogans serovar Grippotyphosa str. UI 12764]|nr:hypothetical protein LEP1GSC106_0573 [Leptospira interrogans serovar Grippotyphosa str. UI 12764]